MEQEKLTFNKIMEMMGGGDVSGRLEPGHVLLTLALAFGIGLFIYFIYRKTYTGVMYSRTFNLSLLVLTMVSTLAILPITSSLQLSLGMVGALSIVRFRTAVKDAMDTVFMFWSVAVGICLAAGILSVAIIGSLFIGIVLIAMTVLKLRVSMPYLLVLHYHREANNAVRSLLSKLPNHRLKARTLTGDTVEVTVEIRLKQEDSAIVDRFMSIDGMFDASLISYQGDIIS